MRRFVRTLRGQFASRVVIETLLLSFQRSRDADRQGWWPLVLVGVVVVAAPPATFVELAFAWWLLTGRGPGLRLVSYDLGAPPQRPRGRRSRTGGKVGFDFAVEALREERGPLPDANASR
jgi:hypothetical protein